MRVMRRIHQERKYRTPKGGCTHVWRTRSLTLALSGASCEVCETCGVVQVKETDEPAVPVTVHRGGNLLRQPEGAPLGSLA